MSNPSRTLYVGVTNDLQQRVYQHKEKLCEGFTRKYNLTMLVYFETTSDVLVAIAREKQIKGWLRAKKVALKNSEHGMARLECRLVLTGEILRFAQDDRISCHAAPVLYHPEHRAKGLQLAE